VPIRVSRFTTSDYHLGYISPRTTVESLAHGSRLTSHPGVISPSGSCSSLITSIFFSHHHTHGPVPRSLSDLLLYTIAIDTKGLKKGTELDQRAVETLFPHSQYADQDHRKVMKRLSKELKKAKKDLDGLTLTQLIQWVWCRIPSTTLPSAMSRSPHVPRFITTVLNLHVSLT
jgi:hypothetical protein